MNPELQRNLWLEASRRQLVFAGAITAMIFVAVWLLDRGRSAYDFVGVGAVMFVACALVWAPRQARASVVDEVYGRTWDLQRLSALTPWTMTWGKLVGATSRTWVFSGAALVIAFLQYASLTSTPHALFWVLIGFGLAALLQASGMAVGLIEIRKARVLGRLPGLRSPGLIGLGFVLVIGASAIWSHHHAAWTANLGKGTLAAAGRPLVWWGRPHDPSAFAAISLIVFGGWATAWAWRLMRLELQLQNAPWAWPLFVVMAGLYVAGFDPAPDAAGGLTSGRLTFAGLVFAACAYLGAFIDPADRVQARGFAGAVTRGRWARLAGHIPLIAAPAVLCALVTLWSAMIQSREGSGWTALTLLAALSFLLRDLGVIAALRFAPEGRRGDFGVLIALLLLYVLGALFGRVFAGAGGLALFIPSLRFPALSLMAGCGEAALAWTLAAWRISQPTTGRRLGRNGLKVLNSR